MSGDTCPTVLARQKQDRRRGYTTSQAAIDFVRRTCSRVVQESPL